MLLGPVVSATKLTLVRKVLLAAVIIDAMATAMPPTGRMTVNKMLVWMRASNSRCE